MRRLSAAGLAAAACGVLAGSTAATARLVQLWLNDLIDVAGTRIACSAQIGTTNLRLRDHEPPRTDSRRRGAEGTAARSIGRSKPR